MVLTQGGGDTGRCGVNGRVHRSDAVGVGVSCSGDAVGVDDYSHIPKGKSIEKDGQAGVVESTKAASDIYSPIAGDILEVNKSIVDDPSSVNKDPEGKAWFFKIKIKNKSDLDELMSKADYEKFAKENKN